jgi:hypothetical protein
MTPTTPSGCFTTRVEAGWNQRTGLSSGRIHAATHAFACFASCSEEDLQNLRFVNRAMAEIRVDRRGDGVRGAAAAGRPRRDGRFVRAVDWIVPEARALKLEQAFEAGTLFWRCGHK